jgi:iron complex transport system substrate-binding protein
MRRLSLLAVTAAAALPGCALHVEDESRETDKPLKVQHAGGVTKVPGQAERIVALEPDAVDDSLALGVRPVGTAVPKGGIPSYLRRRLGDVTAVGPIARPDLETIDLLEPDLILGSRRHHRRLYDRLSEIAPTVLSENVGKDWKLNLRLHGEALGRTDSAERFLIDYDRRIARVRQAVARPKRPRPLTAELRPDFVDVVAGDLGLRLSGARGPASGILAARGLLGQLERAGRGRSAR